MAKISHFTQTVNGVSTTYDIHDAGAVPRSGGAVLDKVYARTVDNDSLLLIGGPEYNRGAYIELYGKEQATRPGQILMSCRKQDGTAYSLSLHPDGSATWGNKNLAMQEDTVPRSGGNVFNSNDFGRNSVQAYLQFTGGKITENNGCIVLYGGEQSSHAGEVLINASNPTLSKYMWMLPNGTWTWSGTACQITSDQRLKQQITEIDDKLLDAWEDVNLVQFKYNDAVDQKGKDKARLHTGYVVQQIDKACKEHDVDISAYGLYCHEEYPQETEEVEVEQADGTTTKETKVIREASEHYSLRYTEVYAVECMYLRRCIKQLTARIEQLEKENNTK